MKSIVRWFARDGQRGFTLIEAAVALAISGILITGITVFSLQTMSVTDTSKDRMNAQMQVENAGFWMSRDIQMSQNITLGQNAGFPLQLVWRDTTLNLYQATYALDASGLRRSLVKNGQAPMQVLIAGGIAVGSSQTSISQTGGLLAFRVTAVSGGVSVSHTYNIQPRLQVLK